MKEFMYRYRMLLPLGFLNDPKNKDKSGQIDFVAVAKTVLGKVALSSADGTLQWQLGKTKVFMKEGQVRQPPSPLHSVEVSLILCCTERGSGNRTQSGHLGQGGDHPVVVAHGVDAQLLHRDPPGSQARPSRYALQCSIRSTDL
jgi:hypothetical protein